MTGAFPEEIPEDKKFSVEHIDPAEIFMDEDEVKDITIDRAIGAMLHAQKEEADKRAIVGKIVAAIGSTVDGIAALREAWETLS